MSDTIIFTTSGDSGIQAPEPDRARRPREFVQGIERGFAVIQAFSAVNPSLTIAQVAALTGFTRAVARRYLLTFKSLGYVAQEGDRFSLTPRLLDVGRTYLSTLDLSSVVQPYIVQVTDTLDESCSIAVLDLDEIVYVARRPARRGVNSHLSVGSRLPAHATSAGKVLLAHLPRTGLQRYLASATLHRETENTIVDENELTKTLAEVRACGWAVADEEVAPGVRAIAVPIADNSGMVKAAISAAGHASRVSLERLQEEFLPTLIHAARGVSEALTASINPVPTDSH